MAVTIKYILVSITFALYRKDRSVYEVREPLGHHIHMS